MNRQIRSLGLTLVELMAVVAIIALLAGIGAFYVAGSRPNNARLNLLNDVETLLHTQRMRATSMNVATYVRFEKKAIVPRIGDVSICVANDLEQLNIKYQMTGSGKGNNVAIDLTGGVEGKFRTLDSMDSSKYAAGGDYPDGIVTLESKLYNIAGGAIADGNDGDVVICFQPNGQASFIVNNSFNDNAKSAKLRIMAKNNTKEGYFIEVTGLGAIRSWSSPTARGDAF